MGPAPGERAGHEIPTSIVASGWSRTKLRRAEWPEPLQELAPLVLANPLPTLIWWGPDLLQLHNDVARDQLLGDRHAEALGAPAARVWAETWPSMTAGVTAALQGSGALSPAPIRLVTIRNGVAAESHWTFSYTPLKCEDGTLAIVVTAQDRTAELTGERKLQLLSMLASVDAGASTQDVCEHSARSFTCIPGVPFALLYLMDDDGTTARLASASGVDRESFGDALQSIRLDAATSVWPFAEAACSGDVVPVDIRPDSFDGDERVSEGHVTPKTPNTCKTLCLPIPRIGQSLPYGFLIVGVEARSGSTWHPILRLASRQIAMNLATSLAATSTRGGADEQAEHDRAKTAFFANISHELRTPLTLMIGPLEEARDNLRAPAEVRDQLALAHRNALRLLKLVNSLLDFSSIAAGHVRAAYEPTNISLLTRELANCFRDAFSRAGLELRLDCPPLAAPVYLDHEMWEQIVFNLLSNAIKFTLAGEVEISIRSEGDHAVMRVRDTGSGIPAEDLPHIFQPFHRSRSGAARTMEGSGIGLPLVYELVKLHGGELSVASEPSRGSTFTVRIPLGLAHLPAERIRPQRASESAMASAAPYLQDVLRWLPSEHEQEGADSAVPEHADAAADRRFAWDWNLDTLEASFSGSKQPVFGGPWLGIHSGEAIVHPDDLAAHRAAIERAIHHCGELRSELRIRGSGDKHWRWVAVHARIHADAQGRANRASGVTLDITDRKHAELRHAFLLNLTDRLRVLPDPVEIMATATELLGRHLRVDRAMYCDIEANGEFFCVEKDWTNGRCSSLVGRHRLAELGMAVACDLRAGKPVELDDVRTDERAAPVRAAYDAIGARAVIAVPLMKGDRLVASLVVHDASPRTWTDEEVALMYEVVERTSEKLARARIQLALRESESRFSALADGVPLPIWVIGRQGEVQFVNQAFCEYFGTERHEVELRGGWHALVPADDRTLIEDIDAALRERRALRSVCRMRRADGQWRWTESHGVPRYGADDSFVGLSGMTFDITEQRELEAAREQMLAAERAARAAAESATRSKDEFLASLSHELRTPLSVIVAWSRMLNRKFGSRDAQLAEGLGILCDSALAQSNLICDLLDMSRISSGKMTLELEPLDLHELVSSAVNAQRPAAEAKGLTLELHEDARLGLVLADNTRLKQAIWNLLSNAIKFTPSGGRIDVTVCRRNERFTIAVSDTGEGIDPAFLPRIFDRFSQAEGTSARKHGGLGLGLAIVKQLVEMHGGAVEASSPGPMGGATFTISLPAHRPRDSALQARPAPDALTIERLSGCRVLAVEDETHMLQYLKRVLEEYGAEVCPVSSAQEALQVLRAAERPYQVLLTDIGMADMDGYELIRAVREDLALSPHRLPAIAVTALAREEDRRRALSAGFQAHVSKPLHISQLISLLRKTARPSPEGTSEQV